MKGRGVGSVGEVVARGQTRQCLSDHAKDFRFNSKCDEKTVEDSEHRSKKIRSIFYKDHSGYCVNRLQRSKSGSRDL